MEDHNLKKALSSRRGKGIDISVVLGEHDPVDKVQGSHGVNPADKEYEATHKSDLAPAPDHPLDVDHGAGVPEMQPPQHSDLSQMKDSDLLDGMSEYDKHQSSERAPRSLRERAQKAMLLASKK